jgi:hypothetical protein
MSTNHAVTRDYRIYKDYNVMVASNGIKYIKNLINLSTSSQNIWMAEQMHLPYMLHLCTSYKKHIKSVAFP